MDGVAPLIPFCVACFILSFCRGMIYLPNMYATCQATIVQRERWRGRAGVVHSQAIQWSKLHVNYVTKTAMLGDTCPILRPYKKLKLIFLLMSLARRVESRVKDDLPALAEKKISISKCCWQLFLTQVCSIFFRLWSPVGRGTPNGVLRFSTLSDAGEPNTLAQQDIPTLSPHMRPERACSLYFQLLINHLIQILTKIITWMVKQWLFLLLNVCFTYILTIFTLFWGYYCMKCQLNSSNR